MKDYLRRLWNWFKEGKFLYFFIIIFLLTFQIDRIKIGFDTVDNIRFYGLLLQLIGTSTIIYSLKGKLLMFKGRGLLLFFGDYFKSFPLRKIKMDCRLEGNIVTINTEIGRPRLIINPKQDLNEVIEYFQKEIDELHKMFDLIEDNFKKKLNNLDNKIANVKNSLSKEISETKLMIIESAVSNIWLDSFGLACLFWGIILGTAPDIIEKIV